MRFFSQSFLYDDPWSTVCLAFFLRYPNPYASHVVSCDVLSRTSSSSGTLLTTRLILKRGALPKWAPKGIVSRAESWVLEESEVDPGGRIVRCITRNLDHRKILQVEESVVLKENDDGRTLQCTEGRFVSAFGWGLTKRIENHGLSRFKANIQKSREGIVLVLRLLRESRLQHMALQVGPAATSLDSHVYMRPRSHTSRNTTVHDDQAIHPDDLERNRIAKNASTGGSHGGNWSKLRTWLRWD